MLYDKITNTQGKKEDEEDREKKEVTIILTKNNDIYNTGIVL